MGFGKKVSGTVALVAGLAGSALCGLIDTATVDITGAKLGTGVDDQCVLDNCVCQTCGLTFSNRSLGGSKTNR